MIQFGKAETSITKELETRITTMNLPLLSEN